MRFFYSQPKPARVAFQTASTYKQPSKKPPACPVSSLHLLIYVTA